MQSYNFCPNCGNLLPQGAKTCPNCGTSQIGFLNTPIKKEPSGRSSTFETKKRDKAPVKKWGHFSWILLLMGAALGLYALFTPAGSVNLGGLYSWDMWMVGYNEVYDFETGWDIFWTMNEDLFVISLSSTVFVVIGNVLALVGAISLITRGIHKSNLAIASSIVAGGATLFYLAGYQVMFSIYTQESFWTLLYPAFGVYGQFLAALLMALAYFIARSAGKYQVLYEKYKRQENLFSIIKMFLEKEQLPEEQRESLSKRLEIVELRFKGIALLKNRIESLSHKKHKTPYLEPTEFALAYFQKALELSSEQNQTIVKKDLQIDLQLVSKIMMEQDKRRALFYLSQIQNQTEFFLGDLLMMIRFVKPKDKYDWKHKIIPNETTPSQQSLSSPPKTEIDATNQEKKSLSKDQKNQEN